MNYQGDHTVPLHLAPALRSGLIKYMAKHDLDKQYAALSLLTKSLRSEGLISEEDYNFFIERYSKTVSSMSQATQPTKPLSPEQQQTQQKIDEKTRYFSAVLNQWKDHLSSEWRAKKKFEAKQYPEIESAKLILDL